MKKNYFKTLIITLFVFVMIAIGMVANAQDNEDIKVFVNGRQVMFDVQPQTINDRTMVPIRAIFEKMGATVEWDEATKTAICTKDETTVKMTIDSTTMYINNSPLQMDVSPVVIDNRTLAPARYVAEAYGGNVQWSEEERNVVICTDGIFAYADYPDVPDLGKCYNIPLYSNEYKDGFVLYTYVYSDQSNDDYYSDIFDKSAAVLGNYKEESQGVDEKGVLTIAYTKNLQETPRFYIYASMLKNGDMGFVVAIPDQKEITKVTMYATDGRTIDVLPNEVDSYLNVGWYRTLEETQQTMYAPDGRTITVFKSEVPEYINVGWYETYSQAQNVNNTTNNKAQTNNPSADGYYYRTPTGKKYHLDPNCGGKNSYRTTNISGLSPCKKCAQ